MEYIHIRTLLSYPNIMAYIRSMTELQQHEPHFDSRTAVKYYLRAGPLFKFPTAPVRAVPRSMRSDTIMVLCWRYKGVKQRIADLQKMAVAELLQSFNSVHGPMERKGIS